MLRRLVFAFPFALVALAPASSLAAEDCPDGWFCENSGTPRQAPAPSDAPENGQPGAPPGAPPRPTRPPSPDYPPSYPPPGYAPQMHFDAPDNPPAQKRRRRQYREWGFNLHLEAALLGDKSERASDAGMAGLGFGIRYRLIPPLAFEVGLDLLTGTDFQGYSRSEAGLLFNTLVFFNPHDVIQLYGLGGLGFSGATVTIAPRSGEAWYPRHDEHYSYFGGQLGLGVEVRVTRRIALAGDIVGFIRGRTDDLADDVPEFTDPNTHRTTNTSGGGLLRAGATFYW